MEAEIKIWEDSILPDLDDNLVIIVEIPVWDETDYTIRVKIHWKSDETDIYIIDCLHLYKPCVIEYTFQNEIFIKGTLTINKFYEPGSNHTHGVFGNFKYYTDASANYFWHTEGFLISFYPRRIVVDEIETIEIVEKPIIRAAIEEIVKETDPVMSSDDYVDLFPYIYVNGWPKLSNAERMENFFSYNPPSISPPIQTFTDTLVSLKSSGNRAGMQSEAIAFIEGTESYALFYVNNVEVLKGEIRFFLELYSDLKCSENLYDVVLRVCLFLDCTSQELMAYLKSTQYAIAKERLWESYFALLIEMGYERNNLEEIIKVLTTCNFLEHIFSRLHIKEERTRLSEETLYNLLNATIVLPSDIFPLPPYSSSPPVQSPEPILPYAIGDLHLVKYKLLRYQIGEVASVTSIMPGEKRKTVNRKLDRVLDKEVVESRSSNESDETTHEQNNDFNEELWNAIAETTETTSYPDPGLKTTYGPPTDITISGSFTKVNTTQAPDKKQLSSFAKKILNKTTQRLSETMSKVRAHSELKELEDTAISLVNNTMGTDPVYGIYCWLNKIYEAKVINYGNRMLFSFIIEEPAVAFIERARTLDGISLTEPKTLEDFGITTYESITSTNYLAACQYYQLETFPLYPVSSKIVSDVAGISESKLISIPEGYFAFSATVDYAFGTGSSNGEVNGFIGQNTFSFNGADNPVGIKTFPTLNNEQNAIAVGSSFNPTITMSPPNSELDFHMAIEVTCSPSSDTILLWQIKMYQLLSKAWSELSAAYYAKIDVPPNKHETSNPLSERLIVKQELEQSIRKQLLNNALAVNGLPSSNINSTAAPTLQFNQPEITQYLNTTLEWKEMSYTFFDEYDDQSGIFAVSSVAPDFFSGFLKAKYARVIIPLDPRFNEGFLYFLTTGMVWSTIDRLAPCFEKESTDGAINADQLSIVNQLKKTMYHRAFVPNLVDEWEVVIPTSMQLLQDKKNLTIKDYE